MGFDQDRFHVDTDCCLHFWYAGTTQVSGFFSLQLIGKGDSGDGIGFYLHQSNQIGDRLFNGGRFRFGTRSCLGGRLDVTQDIFYLLYGLFVFTGRNGGHVLEAVLVVGGQDGRCDHISVADGEIGSSLFVTDGLFDGCSDTVAFGDE